MFCFSYWKCCSLICSISRNYNAIADQVTITLFSQLIKGISRVLQKMLKYFNGAIISTSFAPLLPVWPVIFSLKWNESLRLSKVKSTISTLLFTAGISLQYCYKLPDVLE